MVVVVVVVEDVVEDVVEVVVEVVEEEVEMEVVKLVLLLEAFFLLLHACLYFLMCRHASLYGHDPEDQSNKFTFMKNFSVYWHLLVVYLLESSFQTVNLLQNVRLNFTNSMDLFLSSVDNNM